MFIHKFDIAKKRLEEDYGLEVVAMPNALKGVDYLYEHPEANFMDMAMRFCDIRKRIYPFPKMGEKAYFIAVPTSAGTGSATLIYSIFNSNLFNTKSLL